MEATINNYLFKLDKANNIIEVFYGSEADRPHGYIRVDAGISEKDFHYEISDWYMNNGKY